MGRSRRSPEAEADADATLNRLRKGDASDNLPLLVLDRKADQRSLWLMPGGQRFDL